MMAESLHERLGALITQIMHEERDFQERARQMRIDQQSLDEVHEEGKPCHVKMPNHQRLRMAHEAMFKVHRKIASNHTGVMVYCRRIAEKLRGGRFSEREIASQLDHLQAVFTDMRSEHQNMERERRKILREHNELFDEEGCVNSHD
jgi:hypothetical protein